jgi:hypothetical protein
VSQPGETPDEQDDQPSIPLSRTHRRRGSFALYGASFALVLAAGVSLAIAATNFLASVTPLWISVALSSTATVLAIASIVVPRRG